MKNRMTKNNVHTLTYLVVLFLFVFPTTKIFAENSQATVIVPPKLIITILGSSTVNMAIGGTYTDAGATVLDTSNGIVPVTTIFNNVNTTATGTYSVVYEATDIAGSVATATRVVNVIAPTPTGGGGRRGAQLADIIPLGMGGNTEPIPVLPLESNEQLSILPTDFCFNKNLYPYTSDPNVKYLQIFLNNNGFFTVSNGSENNYYDAETENAVNLFQEQSVIIPFLPFDTIPATGDFDYATRKKANDILGCATTPEVVASTTPNEISTEGVSTTTTPEVITKTENIIPGKGSQNNNNNVPINTEVGNPAVIKAPITNANPNEKIVTPSNVPTPQTNTNLQLLLEKIHTAINQNYKAILVTMAVAVLSFMFYFIVYII